MTEAKSKPQRPFSMEHTEAKTKIINAVNEATEIHGIPFYLLEDMLFGIYLQTKDCARLERENAARIYNKQLQESEEQKG
jgi:hypothetical protein